MQGRHMGMIRSLICHPKIRQLYRIGSMLCMYICIIALAAIGVMTYVRSISVATDNKGIFESLTKLGADHAYQRMVLKKQLAKIFFYPGIVGCGAGFLFSFMMDYTNDGGDNSNRNQSAWKSFVTDCNFLFCIVFCISCF